jgi:hypothetical protein
MHQVNVLEAIRRRAVNIFHQNVHMAQQIIRIYFSPIIGNVLSNCFSFGNFSGFNAVTGNRKRAASLLYCLQQRRLRISIEEQRPKALLIGF